MRILHVLDHSIPLQSGYTFRTRAILEQQRQLGWETQHVTGPRQRSGDVSEEVVDGLHFFRCPDSSGLASRFQLARHYDVVRALRECLEAIIARDRPDIIHAHSPALNGLAALQVGRRRGIPVVYEVRAFWEDAAVDHGSTRDGSLRYRLTRALETYVLRRADAVTTICAGLEGDIVDRGVSAERVTVIPNAVDVEKFSKVATVQTRDYKKQLGLVGKRLIGFIGSFYAYEGLAILLRAIPALTSRFNDVRVVLVGGGPDEKNLKAIARDLGLQDKAIFVGRVPHGEVQYYYDMFDVMVYPRISIRLTEIVTPLKPLEAMARGCLVAASDVGGHRELIRDGKTGVLFRADDPNALADRIGWLLTHPQNGEALRQQARLFVEQERNWPSSVARYGEIYARVRDRSAH